MVEPLAPAEVPASKAEHEVFIIYTHDSPEHKKRVRWLAQLLREDGLDCHLDQYEHPPPPEGWARWSVTQIKKAKFVLVVCTAELERRFDEEGGLGGIWEAKLITDYIYTAKSRNHKFIPVIFAAEDEAHVPQALRGANCYDLKRADHRDQLYSHLTGQPLVDKPPLGKRRVLFADEPVEHFFESGAAAGLARPRKKNLLSRRLDRREQDRAFRTAMRGHHEAKSSCPLVCVIHGDHGECHIQFLLRIRDRLMPEMFRSLEPGSMEEPVIVKYLMKVSFGELTEEASERCLWKSLREAVGVTDYDGEERVRSFVTEKRSGVIIYVDLETEHWDGVAPERLDQFLRFWGGEWWQNLPEGFVLLVCLCCTYKEKPVSGEWKSPGPNDDMRAYIGGLKHGAREGIYLTPIDELLAVEHADVKELADDPEVELDYDFRYDDIEELYSRKENCVSGGRIKMALLLNLLEQINRLKETAGRGGGQ